MGNKLKVCVIGAGVCGLSAAVKIQENFQENVQVYVLASEYSPLTTGDGSAGLWFPYLCGNTSQECLSRWGVKTYEFFQDLWLQGLVGCVLVPVLAFDLSNDQQIERPLWCSKVLGFQNISIAQLQNYNKIIGKSYKTGITFITFTVEVSKLLEYLTQKFELAGGTFTARKTVIDLDDPILSDYDVIVNCSGLGAKYLVGDDKVFPIRGQVHRVRAPWVNEVILDEDNYIIPNMELCVLGGTHDENEFSRDLRVSDKETIFKITARMMPSVQHAEKVSDWVGLRPGRDQVRLEGEMRRGKLIVHNYGHGGSGVTLAWGCADDVVAIISNFMNCKSKL